MRWKMRGRVHAAGDWVHEREILGDAVPAVPRVSDLDSAAAGLLQRLGPPGPAPFERGDIMVAGRGFGLGTTRDHTALLLRLFGFGAILCGSVDMAFRASALRLGLPVLVLPGIRATVEPGDELIVSIDNGTIENLRSRRVLLAPTPTPHEMRVLAQAPGLALMGVPDPRDEDPDVMEVGPARRPDAPAA